MDGNETLRRAVEIAMEAKQNIQFVCSPEDYGVIAEPVPAKSQQPEWFRKLPPVNKEFLNTGDNGQTVKRCMPILDAMNAGWLLPLAATVRIEVSDDGKNVTSGWDFDRSMVSNHSAYQLAGHPKQPQPVCKFHNYWTIITPPGWSCLFVPIINREQPHFEVFSGIVDTDTFTTRVNFPFMMKAPDGLYVIKKGTPIVQVIPFKRDAFDLDGIVRSETLADRRNRDRIDRNVHSGPGWYRDHARDAR
jgi:Family of unknown function (DUF6065)